MSQTAVIKESASSSRLLLNEMISSMREGIILVEHDGVISAANEAASNFLGGRDLESQQLIAVINDDIIRGAFAAPSKKANALKQKLRFVFAMTTAFTICG